jgi:hypothetical protein
MKMATDPLEPPMLLDSARVVEYATFDSDARAAARGSAVVGGVAVDFDAIAGLVIAEDLVKGAIFLLHCNADWATVAAGTYADVETARASAESAYAGTAIRWKRFRELSAEERAEVESTRRFLRELVADYPDE